MRISRAELWQAVLAQAVLVGAAVLKPTDGRTSLEIILAAASQHLLLLSWPHCIQQRLDPKHSVYSSNLSLCYQKLQVLLQAKVLFLPFVPATLGTSVASVCRTRADICSLSEGVGGHKLNFSLVFRMYYSYTQIIKQLHLDFSGAAVGFSVCPWHRTTTAGFIQPWLLAGYPGLHSCGSSPDLQLYFSKYQWQPVVILQEYTVSTSCEWSSYTG